MNISNGLNETQGFVNIDTGEYFEINQGDRVRIIRKEQQEAISKAINTKELNEEVKYWNKELGGFIFVLFKYYDDIFKQHPEITPEDITKLFYLATYLDYDGYLISKGAYMKRSDMQRLLRLGRNAFDTFFNKMKSLGVFLQDSNNNIKMDKSHFVKGSIDKKVQQHADYTRIYINTIRYLFENVPYRSHRQLGMYFKMIPYIHRQYNTLCHNPDSKADNIRLMNVRELRDVLGYSKNGIKKFIDDMISTTLSNGETIIGYVRTNRDEGRSYVIINPNVYYGGNYDIRGGRNEIMKWF